MLEVMQLLKKLVWQKVCSYIEAKCVETQLLYKKFSNTKVLSIIKHNKAYWKNDMMIKKFKNKILK